MRGFLIRLNQIWASKQKRIHLPHQSLNSQHNYFFLILKNAGQGTLAFSYQIHGHRLLIISAFGLLSASLREPPNGQRKMAAPSQQHRCRSHAYGVNSPQHCHNVWSSGCRPIRIQATSPIQWNKPSVFEDWSCYAHFVEYNILGNKIRPLRFDTDSWCSSGSFLSNGTLLQSGGHGITQDKIFEALWKWPLQLETVKMVTVWCSLVCFESNIACREWSGDPCRRKRVIHLRICA